MIMPTLTIKNIPEDLYRELKRQAKMNRRSINSQVIVCIEKATRSQRLQPEQYIARARDLRNKTAGHPIGDEQFNEAKAQGRP